MPLLNCPACDRLISDAAERCIHCGHPMRTSEPTPPAKPVHEPLFGSSFGGTPVPRTFRGPPHECRYCGGSLKAKREVPNDGVGCLLILVGILLTPILIGIFIILIGLHLGTKGKGYWECQKCDARFDRKIKWWQYG